MHGKFWTFDQSAYERLDTLMKVVSPSMDETAMAAFLRRQWADCGFAPETDVMGSLYACCRGEREIDLAICAHMDTVAVQVTRILPNGMLQFRRIGLTPHVLLGQRLKIKTSKGVIPGVVGFDPTSQYGQPKGLVDEDLWIDICACSQAEAESMVSIGDLGVIEGGLAPFKDGFLCGSGIDDRIGIFVLNECMKWYADKKIPVNLHFVATAQEEVGLRGGAVAAARHKHDACIILDVDYATDTLVPHENQMGPLRLGCGPGMQVKADNNPILRRIAVETAQKMGMDYQISVGRFVYGGTDSSPIQVTGKGVATLNLNIPCRYMHSPVEICSSKDVESAVNLLIGVISTIGSRESSTFIPGID